MGWLDEQFVTCWTRALPQSRYEDLLQQASRVNSAPTPPALSRMPLGSCSTGVDLIIVLSHCYLLVRLPLALFRMCLQPRRRVARAPMTRSAEARWVGGPVGSRACAPFSRSSRHPSPAQYGLLSRLRTGPGATDWLLGLRFWRSSSGDGSVLFPQYISGTLTSHTLLKHNWPTTSDRQYCCWPTSRQLECLTPHHLRDVCYHWYSSSTEMTLVTKSDLNVT